MLNPNWVTFCHLSGYGRIMTTLPYSWTHYEMRAQKACVWSYCLVLSWYSPQSRGLLWFWHFLPTGELLFTPRVIFFRAYHEQISQLSFCHALKWQKWIQFDFEHYDLVNESYAIAFVPNKIFISWVEYTKFLWIFNEYLRSY